MKLGELYQFHLCPRPHHPGASGGLFVRHIEEKCDESKEGDGAP